MKHILRSPIEPEFAYFVKTAFRKKKVALQSRVQSDLARSRVFLLAQKKRLITGIQKVRGEVTLWKKDFQEKYFDLSRNLQKSLKKRKVESVAATVQPEEKETAPAPFATQINTSPSSFFRKFRNGVAALRTIRMRPLRENWHSSVGKTHFLAGIFFLTLLAGMGFKTLARDSITIGFDDYKLSDSGNIVDLNAVQKRLLSTEAFASPPSPLEGEQCTE